VYNSVHSAGLQPMLANRTTTRSSSLRNTNQLHSTTTLILVAVWVCSAARTTILVVSRRGLECVTTAPTTGAVTHKREGQVARGVLMQRHKGMEEERGGGGSRGEGCNNMTTHTAVRYKPYTHTQPIIKPETELHRPAGPSERPNAHNRMHVRTHADRQIDRQTRRPTRQHTNRHTVCGIEA